MFRLKIRHHGKDIHHVDLESGREYTFGRGSNCDVVLEPEAGISRTHFRVYEDAGSWQVQGMSKFGEIRYGGQVTNEFALEPGTRFDVTGYDFYFNHAEEISQFSGNVSNVVYMQSATFKKAAGDASSAVAVRSSNVPALLHMPMSPYQAPQDFEGSEEATRIVATAAGVPHIRMLERDGTETTLKLEGRIWIAGREDGCDLLLNDRKSSRRQFELTSSPQGFFIRDMGSSNGTTLNGVLLAHDELKALRSGDVIRVGQVTMYFEIRDPHFEQRLMVISPDVLNRTHDVEQPYEMINFPVMSGPGGAVRYDAYSNGFAPAHSQGANGLRSWLDYKNADVAKKKKIRFYAVGLFIILIILYLGLGGNNQPQVAKDTSPFARLNPQKQKVIKETYILANNLVLTGKYDLAMGELKKIHEILPEGYEHSHSLEDQCKQYIQNLIVQGEAEAERRRVLENLSRFNETVKNCERLIHTARSVEEMQACLSPARDIDPANPKLDQMILSVQQRVDAAKASLLSQREYQERVEKGRSLFLKAQTLEANNQTFEALEAYNKHMNSTLPDPHNLKLKSKMAIISMNRKISAQVEEGLTAAQAAYAQQNYREAITQIKKVKALDPKNEKVADLNANVRRELNTKLKELYEESVIDESLGQLDKAKELWKKIKEMDHPEGDYYPKATHKLKTYGTF